MEVVGAGTVAVDVAAVGTVVVVDVAAAGTVVVVDVVAVRGVVVVVAAPAGVTPGAPSDQAIPSSSSAVAALADHQPASVKKDASATRLLSRIAATVNLPS